MGKHIILIKTGSTHAGIRKQYGDFEDWFMQAWPEHTITLIDALTTQEYPRLTPGVGIVITGSPAMVTDQEPWSERLGQWLAQTAHSRVPILGVCYGHQLLAHALGGSVHWHPQGREMGTVAIDLDPAGITDNLLGTLPATFTAQVTHAQSVKILPPGGERLAHNAFEPNHAFRVGDSTWGVQFHPEFNQTIMRAYIEETNADPALLTQLADANANLKLLQRFAELI